MTNKEVKELSQKFKTGINLAFKNLLAKRILEDGEFVISKNGKIVHVKAKELLKLK